MVHPIALATPALLPSMQSGSWARPTGPCCFGPTANVRRVGRPRSDRYPHCFDRRALSEASERCFSSLGIAPSLTLLDAGHMRLANPVAPSQDRLRFGGRPYLGDLLSGQLRAAPPSYILGRSHRFEVLWIDAGRHPAQVIDLQTRGNRTVCPLVVVTMRVPARATVISNQPIAASGASKGPDPAVARVAGRDLDVPHMPAAMVPSHITQWRSLDASGRGVRRLSEARLGSAPAPARADRYARPSRPGCRR